MEGYMTLVKENDCILTFWTLFPLCVHLGYVRWNKSTWKERPLCRSWLSCGLGTWIPGGMSGITSLLFPIPAPTNMLLRGRRRCFKRVGQWQSYADPDGVCSLASVWLDLDCQEHLQNKVKDERRRFHVSFSLCWSVIQINKNRWTENQEENKICS